MPRHSDENVMPSNLEIDANSASPLAITSPDPLSTKLTLPRRSTAARTLTTSINGMPSRPLQKKIYWWNALVRPMRGIRFIGVTSKCETRSGGSKIVHPWSFRVTPLTRFARLNTYFCYKLRKSLPKHDFHAWNLAASSTSSCLVSPCIRYWRFVGEYPSRCNFTKNATRGLILKRSKVQNINTTVQVYIVTSFFWSQAGEHLVKYVIVLFVRQWMYHSRLIQEITMYLSPV